jgi:histidine triad (HIT) family protein
MFNHEPEGYDCPFCRVVRGEDTRGTTQRDVVLRDESVTAFMSVMWWPNNPGHVIVVPNPHIENIYDLPPGLATPLQAAMRLVALAMKAAYGCTGISTRQHNEPDGSQHVWHHHTHVFPRYANDDLYLLAPRRSTVEERLPYAERLRAALAEQAGHR